MSEHPASDRIAQRYGGRSAWGRTAFLAKPFGVEELTTRLQEVLTPVPA